MHLTSSMLLQEPYNHISFKLIICAHIPSGNSSPVHAKSYLKPPCKVCYKQSWAHFLAFLTLSPKGSCVLLSFFGLLESCSRLVLSFLSWSLIITPPPPAAAPLAPFHRLLIHWLSCCIFAPSVHRKSNKAKSVQQHEEPGRNTLQALNWMQV